MESNYNRCCMCLRLRTGCVIIGIINCVFYLCMFSWYLIFNGSYTPTTEVVHREDWLVTCLDIFVFSSFCMQILVNTLLIVGALRKISSHLFPWLCVTAACIILVTVLLISTMFFGTTKLGLEYSEYITSLVLMGLVIVINFFCWITVFVFRKNLLLEFHQQRMHLGKHNISPIETTPPPPSYQDLDFGHTLDEDPPPEYETVIAEINTDSKLSEKTDTV